MTHMVIHRNAEGQPVYHETDSLDAAARHIEHLRNAGQGADARIFSMVEVPIEVRTYYKVELPAAAPSASPQAAASEPQPAPAPAPAESQPAPAQPAPAAVKGTPTPDKAEPAAAGANGGRFGLFGKG